MSEVFEKKRVSVIVPVYNSQNYLEECIYSLINQSYNKIEIILFDDGSEDNSYELCIGFQKKDYRIKVLKSENGGPGKARNLAIQNATGEYIVFVDSDDYVEKMYIERLVDIAENNRVDFVIGGYKKKSKGSIEEFVDERKIGNVEDLKKNIDILLKKSLIQGPCSKLFRRSIVIENDVCFNESWKYGEDTYFVYDYISHIDSYGVSEYADYVYEIRNSSSLSSIFTREKIENNIELSTILENWLGDMSYDSWLGSTLCGNYITFCTDLLKTKLDKYKELSWAVNNLNGYPLFVRYKEDHIIRRVYRYLTIKKRLTLILLISRIRIIMGRR